jgi:hypothetical protein
MLVKSAAARKRAHRVTAMSMVHTRAIGILHTELTQAADTMLRFVRRRCLKSQRSEEDRCTGNAKKLIAADTMLRFARRHCLKSQRSKEDRCTGNAKKLIRQLTAAMKSEHERVQDQLVMEMRSEQAAQPMYKGSYRNVGLHSMLPRKACGRSRSTHPHVRECRLQQEPPISAVPEVPERG